MTTEATYHFPGLRLHAQAPAPWLDAVEAVYAAFREPGYPFPAEEGRLSVEPAAGGWHWSTSLGGGRRGLWGPEAGPSHVMAFLQGQVLVESTCARLFHAAVVARAGRATWIVGPSNLGKTTFCAHLVRAGWDFLSDEAAVLPFDSSRVLAFPRALSLRESSLPVLGVPAEWQALRQPWDGEFRVVVDAEHLRPGCRRPHADLARVVFLRAPSAAPPVDLPHAAFLEIHTEGGSDRFLALLREARGVLRVEQLADRPGEVVRIAHEPHAPISGVVDDCAQRAGVRVTAHVRGCTAPNRHDQPPRLRPVEALHGVQRLLAHLLNGRALAARGPLAHLLVKLAADTRGVRFHEMTPGPLHDMAALLDG